MPEQVCHRRLNLLHLPGWHMRPGFRGSKPDQPAGGGWRDRGGSRLLCQSHRSRRWAAMGGGGCRQQQAASCCWKIAMGGQEGQSRLEMRWEIEMLHCLTDRLLRCAVLPLLPGVRVAGSAGQPSAGGPAFAEHPPAACLRPGQRSQLGQLLIRQHCRWPCCGGAPACRPPAWLPT